jgi:hypothetical protein
LVLALVRNSSRQHVFYMNNGSAKALAAAVFAQTISVFIIRNNSTSRDTSACCTNPGLGVCITPTSWLFGAAFCCCLLLLLLLQAVAGAALAVSSLMNAPPGFLEFLLCIPWRQLPLLYPATNKASGQQSQQQQQQQQQSSQKQQPSQKQQDQPQQQEPQQEQQTPEQLLSHLAVDERERRLLVNMRIHPQLMRPVLDFLYKPEHADSVPPLLRPQQQQQQQQQPDQQGTEAPSAADNVRAGRTSSATGPSSSCMADAKLLDTVAALLDGATPLHCAALRGNPAQVDHLLYCGADATLCNAAGELALELVPVCGSVHKPTRRRQCHCLGPVEQEVRLLGCWWGMGGCICTCSC